LYFVSPLEALHPSCGVHNAPLPGKERMTLATKLNLKHWLCGTNGKSVTAGADNLGFHILGMNLILHYL
jgi:hypothetical protein